MSRLEIRASALFSAQGARPAQEDHVLLNRDKRIFVAADGFGGPGPGSEAAKGAAEALQEFLSKEAGDDEATMPFLLRSYLSLPGNVLFNGLIHANRVLMKMNREKGIHERGGASVLAGYMDGDLLALASVGCCDAWLVRAGSTEGESHARRLVVPRSYLRLRDPFEEPGACDAPLGALGMTEDMEPEIFEARLRPGDALILHTDGLAGACGQEFQALLGDASVSPSEKAKKAVALLEAGSFRDNASAVLLFF